MELAFRLSTGLLEWLSTLGEELWGLMSARKCGLTPEPFDDPSLMEKLNDK